MAREVVALLLTGVLLVAGGAKLFDRAGTRRSVRELGFPAVLGWSVAIGLPLVELTVAAGLVLPATSQAAAAVAASLLATFAVVIGANVARGRRVSCGCFGRLHPSDGSGSTVARNGALALLAVGVALTQPGDLGWEEVLTAVGVGALLGQAVLWYILLRRYGHALRRLQELAGEPKAVSLGAPLVAPDFDLPTLQGRSVGLPDLLARRLPLLLAFVDSRCAPCAALVPELVRLQREFPDRLTVATVADGAPDAVRAMTADATFDVLLSAGSAIAADYGVEGTPGAVLVAPDGTTDSRLRYGAEEILEAVEHVLTGPPRETPRETVGREVPTKHREMEILLVR